MIIAIDGPAGAGKTTIAKKLAEILKIYYLDTGAMYRALTLKALEKRLDLTNPFLLSSLAQSLNLVMQEGKVCLDGKDVSLEIRKPEINQNISVIVAHSQVREVMVRKQQEIGKNQSCVVEGRDITTVVFPQADYKFYLDANLSERTKRRHVEFNEKGVEINSDKVEQDLKRRDYADMNREVGALKISPDAIYIDTTNLSIDEVVERIVGAIHESPETK